MKHDLETDKVTPRIVKTKTWAEIKTEIKKSGATSAAVVVLPA